MSEVLIKPNWLKIRPPTKKFTELKQLLESINLVTVCQEAHCPNMSECWSTGTATFMLLGDVCTRGCRFCNIKTAKKGVLLDENEPMKISTAASLMNLDYVVLTSVDRDDLEDGGANHFAKCIKALKEKNILVEVLIPDYTGENLQLIIDAKPDVIAHNLETVKRLQNRVRDLRANYSKSLQVLKEVKDKSSIITKSSLMLGLGETDKEVIELMHDLRATGVDIFTLGQYLKPSQKHLNVEEYVKPEVFDDLKKRGEKMGFAFIASGPFVRSSYKAGELFIKQWLKKS